MTSKTPIPDALLAGPLRVADFRKAGVSRGRLRAADIRHLGHGIVAVGEATDAWARTIPTTRYVDGKRLLVPTPARTIEVARRCAEMLPALDAQMFYSRRTAAELWSIPVPAARHGLIEVGAFHPRRAPRRPEVAGHRVRTDTMRKAEIWGLPTPSVADTWCLLAAVLDLNDLVAAGDHILTPPRLFFGGRATKPLASFEALTAAAARHKGGAGAAQLREALKMVRWPVDSPAETELRLLIVSSGFSEPSVNCSVPTAGRELHADLGYPRLRIAIDYEGAYHFENGTEQARRDVERYEAMVAAGWRVLRVTALDLRDPSSFLKRLADAIAEASSALFSR